MKKLNFYTASLLALALTLISLPSYAGNIYRFLDKNGVSTLSKTLPPYAAQQGYEILDDKTLRVIERVLTRTETIEQRNAEQAIAEEIKLKQEQEAEQKRLQREQKIADQSLLARYPSVQDIIKTRDGKLTYINKQIEDTLAQKDYLKETLRRLEQSAAEQELSGKAVSSKLSHRIKQIRKDISNNQLHFENLQSEKENNSLQYENDLIRLRELQGIPEPDPVANPGN